MAEKSNRSTIFKSALVILWLVLFGHLLQRDYFIETLDLREAEVIRKGREESFSGIYFKRERIGYVKHRLLDEGEKGFRLEQEAYLRLNILEQNHPVNLLVEASLDRDLVLKEFEFSLDSPFYTTEAKGRVEGTTVNFTLATGKEEISDSIRLDRPPYLSTNHRAYLLQKDIQKGDKFKIPYFDPISLAGKDTVIEYHGFVKELIKGRIYRLHRFTETFSGMRINFWLDEHGKVIKEESPSGFVFIAEPEFKATDIKGRGEEILSSVSVKLSGTMPGNHLERRSLTYRLTYPEEAEVEVNRDRQSLKEDLLTVTMEELPRGNITSCSGPEETLASTPYIQSGNQLIRDKASSLLNDSMDPLARVLVLADWVYLNLEKRPVIGIPDAVTTLNTLRGDCNEHSALFAAMARSAGIPTKVVAGVTFHEGAFYYHAWNEVCINDQWISLDTTKNQLPADVTHIKFVEGETRELVRIGGLLGKLKIEVVPQ